MERLKLYRWQGVNPQGVLCDGMHLSCHPHITEQQLLAEDITLIRLYRQRCYQRNPWSISLLILFFKQLETMLHAGLTLASSLELLCENQQYLYWQTLLQQLLQKIAEGIKLSVAMSYWPQVFSPLITSLIAAGEVTGHLEQSCGQLVSLLDRQAQFRKQLRQTLRYPCITLVVLITVTVGLIHFILPEFAEMYRSLNTPLPLFTQLLLMLTTQLTTLIPYCAIIVSLALLCIYQTEKKSPLARLKRHRQLLRIPIVGHLWLGSQLALLFSTLAMTLKSGLTLLEGLTVVDNLFTSPLWKLALEQVRQQLLAGERLSQAITQSDIFPPLSLLLIHTAEKTGQLESSFTQLAIWYDQQSQDLNQQLISLLEPLMLVVSGSLVGSVVIAIYLPILTLGDALG